MTGSTDNTALDEKAASRFVHSARHFHRPRLANLTLMIGIGSRRLLLRIENGAIKSIDDLASLRPLTSWDVSLTASAEDWQRFWETVPTAGWHDIFALTRYNRMHIEGNLHLFMSHLQFVKDLLASPRSQEERQT